MGLAPDEETKAKVSRLKKHIKVDEDPADNFMLTKLRECR